MAQHFLLSPAAKTLSIASVMRMTDRQAEEMFAAIRWASNDGKPSCPHCGCLGVYECRRPNGSPRFRCKACRKDFSITIKLRCQSADRSFKRCQLRPVRSKHCLGLLYGEASAGADTAEVGK